MSVMRLAWTAAVAILGVGCSFDPPPYRAGPTKVDDAGAHDDETIAPTAPRPRLNPNAFGSSFGGEPSWPTFEPTPPDGGVDPTGLDVPHIGTPVEPASGVFLLGSAMIDTTSMTIRGAIVPPDVYFDVYPQHPSGPELAVLRVGSLTIASSGTVRAVGHRPLVIVASRNVAILGMLDVSARLGDAGAGGVEPAGEGVSSAPPDDITVDPGGGGAGHATAGASGGSVVGVLGGAGGPSYGDDLLTVLTGGAAGGYGSARECAPAPGGAGGGALQIFAASTISVGELGAIYAGGGGGGGGLACRNGDAGGGGGGGSGGAIDLGAEVISIRGTVAAHGGGGGGAGSGGTFAEGRRGADGENGLADRPARGGGEGGAYGTRGGDGGWRLLPAERGQTNFSPGNAGGGGGAVGRIVIRTASPFVNRGTIGPTPVIVPN